MGMTESKRDRNWTDVAAEFSFCLKGHLEQRIDDWQKEVSCPYLDAQSTKRKSYSCFIHIFSNFSDNI
jgi:hypothetical protein